MNITFRKDDLEIAMLKNIERSEWFKPLIAPEDYEEESKEREESFKRLVGLAEEYLGYIGMESLKS